VQERHLSPRSDSSTRKRRQKIRASPLEGATVNIIAMTHLYYNDDKFIVFDAIYNTIRTFAYPIFIVTG